MERSCWRCSRVEHIDLINKATTNLELTGDRSPACGGQGAHGEGTHTDTQTHRRTDAQTHRRTDAQTHMDTDKRTHRDTDTRTHGQTDTRHTDTQTHRDTDTQTHRHTETQTRRRTDTRTHGHTDLQLAVNSIAAYIVCCQPRNSTDTDLGENHCIGDKRQGKCGRDQS